MNFYFQSCRRSYFNNIELFGGCSLFWDKKESRNKPKYPLRGVLEVVSIGLCIVVKTADVFNSNIRQDSLGVRCHPEREFRPLLFSPSLTTQRAESTC